MVGERGQRDPDHQTQAFWKNFEYEYAGTFFSLEYAGKGEIFDNLAIWKEEKYRRLQGTCPVIALSFANVKATTFEKAKIRICQILSDLYIKFYFLRDSDVLTEKDIQYFDRVSDGMAEEDAVVSLHRLCDFIRRYYGKRPIILLDEYDTPMQEAYVYGYWEEIVEFIRNLFNSAFKTNPYLDRAIMTGILVKPEMDAPSPLGSKKPHQVDEVGFPAKLEKPR